MSPSATPRRCLACGVLIVDLRHERTQKSAPIEVERVGAGGNIVIDLLAGAYRIPPKEELARLRAEQPQLLHVNHYINCPAAEYFHQRTANRRRASS